MWPSQEKSKQSDPLGSRALAECTPSCSHRNESVLTRGKAGCCGRGVAAGTCFLRSVMVFCISRTKSLKSFALGTCGCS